jgi:hypothetical protein
VNYPHFLVEKCGLPVSMGIASEETEVSSDDLHPLNMAVSLVPNDNIRKASFLILIEALISRSWVV